MSDEAYNRAIARESRIWPVFLHSFPFDDVQETARDIIYGLYAFSYRGGHGYLEEIEQAELSNLLSDYNSRIAELTTQEQVLVAEIASKRYLAGVDQVIHDQKMETKAEGIAADDALWDAKIAALSADQAALVTLSVKVTAERNKTSAKLSELEAYIDMEGIHLSEVDIEIAEKEIQSSKVDLAKLDADNDILKIQIDTLNSAAKIVEIEAQIARTKADISQTDANIAKIDLLDSELAVEQARTAAASAEESVSSARVTLATARVDGSAEEVTHWATMTAKLTEELTKKTALLTARSQLRLSGLDLRNQEKENSLEIREQSSDAAISMAYADQTNQAVIDELKVVATADRVFNVNALIMAALAAKLKILSADIATALTHTISKAE